MFLLTDSTLNKAGSSTGFYIMAWLPVAVILVFAIRGITQKKKEK